MRREIDKDSGDVSVDIDPEKCLRDYIGDRENLHISESEKKIKKEFSQRCKPVQDFFAAKSLDPGEGLVMLSMATGKNWQTLQYRRFDDALYWFQRNWYRGLEMLSPELHRSMMCAQGPGCEEYRKFYNSKGEYNEKFDQYRKDHGVN